MARATNGWLVVLLSGLLAACGTNNITEDATPSPLAATATLVPSATVTPSETSTATATSSPSVTPTTTAVQPATALFSADPTDADNPFPSDRLLDDTGHVQVPLSQLDPGLPATSEFVGARNYISRVGGQLNAFTGFSTVAALRVRFDHPVVVDTGLNPRGLLLLEYDDLSAAPVPIRANAYDPENTIEVQPIVPLRPKTTYALVVTTVLADLNGTRIQPSADFVAVLAGGAGLSAELQGWHERLQPVVDFVSGTYSIGVPDLALITVFTTGPTTDDLETIQQRLIRGDLVPGGPLFQNSPIAGLETGIFAEGTPQFDGLVPGATNVSGVAVGSFDSFDFRVRPNGAFDPDLVSGARVPPVNHLDFYVTIPKAAAPPGGYPIVIFGHGLGGSSRDVLTAVPGEIGDAPLMGIGISALQHGRRGNPTGFFVLSNITSTREFFRQTAVDEMQLVRMIENAHAAGIVPFDQVNPDRIMYFGVSLGGIIGTVFTTIEPHVPVSMLSVPGGGLLNILDSHDIGNLLEPLISVAVQLPRDNPYFPRFLHRFQQMAQWALDAADPINFAPHTIVPGAQLPNVPVKRVLMHEGIVDNTVPNRTTDELAFAMRLPDLNLTGGCLDQDGCSGIFRYVMTDYGQAALSGHSVSFAIPQAQAQLAEFLNSNGTAVPNSHP